MCPRAVAELHLPFTAIMIPGTKVVAAHRLLSPSHLTKNDPLERENSGQKSSADPSTHRLTDISEQGVKQEYFFRGVIQLPHDPISRCPIEHALYQSYIVDARRECQCQSSCGVRKSDPGARSVVLVEVGICQGGLVLAAAEDENARAHRRGNNHCCFNFIVCATVNSVVVEPCPASGPLE